MIRIFVKEEVSDGRWSQEKEINDLYWFEEKGVHWFDEPGGWGTTRYLFRIEVEVTQEPIS